MVGARDGLYILYPQYFDSQLTRGQGRRVSLDLAVKAPKAIDIFHAAQATGFDPELDPDHHHPAFWNQHAGRVLISVDTVDGTKVGLIRVIAKNLR
jgi:signal recognition particle subunit SRP19